MSEAAVMGATGTVKTMADGTFRIVVDIEPRFAQLAFSLFGAPGTSVALAKITNEAAIEHDNKPAEEKLKGGPLAKLAGMWCNDKKFWTWIEKIHGYIVLDAANAASWLCFHCGIDRRVKLDYDKEAANYFHCHIREPFMEWIANQ